MNKPRFIKLTSITDTIVYLRIDMISDIYATEHVEGTSVRTLGKSSHFYYKETPEQILSAIADLEDSEDE